VTRFPQAIYFPYRLSQKSPTIKHEYERLKLYVRYWMSIKKNVQLMWVDSKNINAIKILMADSGWWVNKTQL
jgi:hypothetical protein